MRQKKKEKTGLTLLQIGSISTCRNVWVVKITWPQPHLIFYGLCCTRLHNMIMATQYLYITTWLHKLNNACYTGLHNTLICYTIQGYIHNTLTGLHNTCYTGYILHNIATQGNTLPLYGYMATQYCYHTQATQYMLHNTCYTVYTILLHRATIPLHG